MKEQPQFKKLGLSMDKNEIVSHMEVDMNRKNDD